MTKKQAEESIRLEPTDSQGCEDHTTSAPLAPKPSYAWMIVVAVIALGYWVAVSAGQERAGNAYQRSGIYDR